MIIVSRNCLVAECGGQDHKWEFERPTLREFRAIQEALGLSPDDFERVLNDQAELVSVQYIDALLMLITILHRRDGVGVAFEDVDADIADLDFMADPVAEPEEKPTGPPATSLPPEVPPPGDSTSGVSTGAESEPRSSATPPTSGGSTA